MHIAWVKAGFYENLILKTVIQQFEQKIQIKKKRKRKHKCVSGEDRTWSLERVKPMMYLCANLTVEMQI